MPYRLIDKGGVKIGVTSIIAPSLGDKVAPAGVNTNIKILDPDTVLPGVIKTLEESEAGFDGPALPWKRRRRDTQMAKKYPQFRIILAAGGYDEPDGKPVKVGNTWILYTGHKGKRVGVLGFYPDNRTEAVQVRVDSTR